MAAALNGRGQSRWQSFKKLTGPERCWVIGHLWVAGKAQAISTRARALADSVGHEPYLDGNWNGGLVDAFRHSIWMALETREIGAKKAEKLGKAHEKGNYRMWKKGLVEDGAFADSASSAMDLWNNAQGIATAKALGKAASDGQMVKEVLDRMAEGEMRVIWQDENGNFLDQDGQVIPKEKIKGRWTNPRSLSPSRLLEVPGEN